MGYGRRLFDSAPSTRGMKRARLEHKKYRKRRAKYYKKLWRK